MKSERIEDLRQNDFTYDANNKLAQISGNWNETLFTESFNYNASGLMSSSVNQETQGGNFSETITYTYDNSGRLTNFSKRNTNVNLAYSGNTVSVSGTIDSETNQTATLTLSDEGWVTQLTKSDLYVQFTYARNGNITSIKKFNNENELQAEYTFTYDLYNNPYYGQLQSVYLERFLNQFWVFNVLSLGGPYGFEFPYFRNNIKDIVQANLGRTQIVYQYDDESYPIYGTKSAFGGTSTFVWEYYE